MNTRYDFSDQHGIVTGAASGIGKAVALLLAESNAGLTLVDRDTSGLEAAARACEEICSTAPLSIDADVSKQSDVQRMVDGTLSRFGKIDFLVTSAGILFRTGFPDIPMHEWDELMATNVRGLFMCNQFVVREMLKQGGGAIVNVASVAGRSISLIGGVHYCASKHAVIGITRHMARELCTRGIRANAFCPGATHTPMIHDNMKPDEIEGLEARIALGRLADPEEHARVIAFMLSDSASYLNGACLDSNGGSVML
ncbi:Oxidoreductase, short-chain dehydrogenase/reductase family [Olavius algarvensis associated proteobacterium Delta 3]|nr:Oxidoreductase, short-chain dehydrogenase/reductase family [Olavius algarvensis associated proteobacterium Delta 3]